MRQTQKEATQESLESRREQLKLYRKSVKEAENAFNRQFWIDECERIELIIDGLKAKLITLNNLSKREF